MVDHEALALLAQSSSEAVIALDGDGRICLINTVGSTLFALDAAAVLGRLVSEVPALEMILPLVEQALATRTFARERLTLPDQREAWFQVIVAPLSDRSVASIITGEMKTLIHELKRPVSAAKSNIAMIQALDPVNLLQKDFARKARGALLGMLKQIHRHVAAAVDRPQSVGAPRNGLLRGIRVAARCDDRPGPAR